MRMVGFVVQHDDRPAAIDNALSEVLDLRGLRRRLWPEHRGQLPGLVLPRVRPLVKLMHVGQIQRAERTGTLALAAHIELKILPEDSQFGGITGSVRKMRPPSKSVRSRSNTMTFGAISRNVFAKSSRASATALK